MGIAMLTTGLVTGFAPLVAAQMLWVLSWSFADGADVAWIRDELGDPAQVPVVLIRAEQSQLIGTVAGLAVVGALAWVTGPSLAMVVTGAAIAAAGVVGLAVAPEAAGGSVAGQMRPGSGSGAGAAGVGAGNAVPD
jgi:hypothetical protein